MKSTSTVLAALAGAALVLALGARPAPAPTEPAEPPAMVVGAFDSRAVAIAHVRSEAFANRLRELREELERARAAGDEDRAAELEALGPALQRRAHAQGFGRAPVDDLLAPVADRLPGVAEEAGVDLIVSRWAVAYRRPDARWVDVTDRMAALFDPDEKTLEAIAEVLRREPLSAEELAGHDD